MAHSNVNLAALIGSRICHDLISPIGAINNGLELLNMSGGNSGVEMELIADSVGSASARIRFFRIAYGAAGDQMIGNAEVVSLLRDSFADSRIKVEWLPKQPMPRAGVRMAFLALQCLETAMPYGGTVEISNRDTAWMIAGHADKLNIDADLWAVLACQEAPADLRPAQVQFALLPAIARDDGRTVTSVIEEKMVQIQL